MCGHGPWTVTVTATTGSGASGQIFLSAQASISYAAWPDWNAYQWQEDVNWHGTPSISSDGRILRVAVSATLYKKTWWVDASGLHEDVDWDPVSCAIIRTI